MPRHSAFLTTPMAFTVDLGGGLFSLRIAELVDVCSEIWG